MLTCCRRKAKSTLQGGVRGLGGVENRADIQVALGRLRWPDQPRMVGGRDMGRSGIGLGVDRNRPNPHHARTANNTQGDLAAIGH